MSSLIVRAQVTLFICFILSHIPFSTYFLTMQKVSYAPDLHQNFPLPKKCKSNY